MQHRIKQFIVSACTVILIGNIHSAAADTASDTEILLNWVENTYPQLFPSRQATQSVEPWLYRYYPESKIYAGINKSDNAVYVLGGTFGDAPTKIDALANLISQINNSGGNGSIAACDAAKIPSGVSYRQSGNVVTITSNGSCIPAPDLSNTNLCQAPQQTTASNISVLGSNTVTASEIIGLSINIPGLPDPIKAIVDASANVKHCTKNAPADTVNVIINSDLCLDITAAVTPLVADFPGVAMTPPVNYLAKGTYTTIRS